MSSQHDFETRLRALFATELRRQGVPNFEAWVDRLASYCSFVAIPLQSTASVDTADGDEGGSSSLAVTEGTAGGMLHRNNPHSSSSSSQHRREQAAPSPSLSPSIFLLDMTHVASGDKPVVALCEALLKVEAPTGRPRHRDISEWHVRWRRCGLSDRVLHHLQLLLSGASKLTMLDVSANPFSEQGRTELLQAAAEGPCDVIITAEDPSVSDSTRARDTRRPYSASSRRSISPPSRSESVPRGPHDVDHRSVVRVRKQHDDDIHGSLLSRSKQQQQQQLQRSPSLTGTSTSVSPSQRSFVRGNAEALQRRRKELFGRSSTAPAVPSNPPTAAANPSPSTGDARAVLARTSPAGHAAAHDDPTTREYPVASPSASVHAPTPAAALFSRTSPSPAPGSQLSQLKLALSKALDKRTPTPPPPPPPAPSTPPQPPSPTHAGVPAAASAGSFAVTHPSSTPSSSTPSSPPSPPQQSTGGGHSPFSTRKHPPPPAATERHAQEGGPRRSEQHDVGDDADASSDAEAREPFVHDRHDQLDMTANLSPMLDSVLDLSALTTTRGTLRQLHQFGGAGTVWDVLDAYEAATRQQQSPESQHTVDTATQARLPAALLGLTSYHAITVLNLSRNHLTSLCAMPATLLRLDVSNNHLASLSGLQQCRMLAVLNARRNELPAIAGLEGNLGIAHLFLGHNRITAIEGLAHLVLLETLDVTFNMLRTQASLRLLSLCSALRHLLLRGNPITEKSPPGLPAVLRNLCPTLLVVDEQRMTRTRLADRALTQRTWRRPADRMERGGGETAYSTMFSPSALSMPAVNTSHAVMNGTDGGTSNSSRNAVSPAGVDNASGVSSSPFTSSRRRSRSQNLPGSRPAPFASSVDGSTYTASRAATPAVGIEERSLGMLQLLTRGVTVPTGYGDAITSQHAAQKLARREHAKAAKEKLERERRLTANGQPLREAVVRQLAEESRRYVEDTIVRRMTANTNLSDHHTQPQQPLPSPLSPRNSTDRRESQPAAWGAAASSPPPSKPQPNTSAAAAASPYRRLEGGEDAEEARRAAATTKEGSLSSLPRGGGGKRGQTTSPARRAASPAAAGPKTAKEREEAALLKRYELRSGHPRKLADHAAPPPPRVATTHAAELRAAAASARRSVSRPDVAATVPPSSQTSSRQVSPARSGSPSLTAAPAASRTSRASSASRAPATVYVEDDATLDALFVENRNDGNFDCEEGWYAGAHHAPHHRKTPAPQQRRRGEREGGEVGSYAALHRAERHTAGPATSPERRTEEEPSEIECSPITKDPQARLMTSLSTTASVNEPTVHQSRPSPHQRRRREQLQQYAYVEHALPPPPLTPATAEARATVMAHRHTALEGGRYASSTRTPAVDSAAVAREATPAATALPSQQPLRHVLQHSSPSPTRSSSAASSALRPSLSSSQGGRLSPSGSNGERHSGDRHTPANPEETAIYPASRSQSPALGAGAGVNGPGGLPWRTMSPAVAAGTVQHTQQVRRITASSSSPQQQQRQRPSSSSPSSARTLVRSATAVPLTTVKAGGFGATPADGAARVTSPTTVAAAAAARTAVPARRRRSLSRDGTADAHGSHRTDTQHDNVPSSEMTPLHIDAAQRQQVRTWVRQHTEDAAAVQEALRMLVTLLEAQRPTTSAASTGPPPPTPESSRDLPRTFLQERRRCVAIIRESGMLLDTQVPMNVVVYYGLSKEELNGGPDRSADVIPREQRNERTWQAEVAERTELLRQVHLMGDAKTCLRYVALLIDDGRERLLQQYVEQLRESLRT